MRDVERLLNEIVNVKGLTARTANHVRVTLRIALGEAQRDGFVAQNVAALAKAPPVKTTDMHMLDADGVRRLIAVVSDTDEAAFWLMAVSTGMNAAPPCGLRCLEG